MAGRIGVALGVINLIGLIFLITLMGSEESEVKTNIVDRVAFDYINIIENEGYLTETTKQNIISELSMFDEVSVVGTSSIVDVGQSVNMTITVKDEGSLLKRDKGFSREILLNGVAR